MDEIENNVAHAPGGELLTCGECVHCLPGPNTANDIMARCCYRFPPKPLAVASPQGIMVITARGEIRSDTWACGEFESKDDEDPENPGLTS